MQHSRVRAITTRYKGYAFRSRLEARWAVFFDHLSIRWEYEPEGFDLGNGLRYLPDFWLPDWHLWVEVKPAAPDAAALEKAVRLAEQHRSFVLVVNGMPGGPCTLAAPRNGESGCVSRHKAWIYWHEGPVGYVDRDSPHLVGAHMEFNPVKQLGHELYGNGADALAAARSARFEFGAKGTM